MDGEGQLSKDALRSIAPDDAPPGTKQMLL
jgi:hypothetical protein